MLGAFFFTCNLGDMRIQDLSAHLQQFIDSSFSRLLQTQGGLPNLPADLSLTQSVLIASSGGQTIWVDGVNGNDAFPGTQVTPLKTISSALARVPFALVDRFVINVLPGTYTETLDLNYAFSGLQGCIDIVGQSWTAVTPATGVASGTFDASFGSPTLLITASVAGAGWTTHDLKGKFIQITSGTNNGKFIPIADNTATTIDLASPATGVAGGMDVRNATFNIVVPAVNIQGSLASDHIVSASGAYFANSFSASTTVSSNGVRFSNINFIQRSGMGTGFRLGVGSNITCQSCSWRLNSSTSFAFVGSMARINLTDCYLGLDPSSGGGISLQPYSILTGNRIIVDGGGAAITVQNAVPAALTLSGVLQNQSQDGIQMYHGSLSAISNLVIRNTDKAIIAYGGSLLQLVGSVANAIVITNCNNGIYAWRGLPNLEGWGNVIDLNLVTITNMTDSGIEVQGTHNFLDLGASTITNCAIFGVNIGESVYSFSNHCVGSSSLVMSGNGNDFTMDGVTGFSLASLRAAPNKAIVESTLRFSRVIEP